MRFAPPTALLAVLTVAGCDLFECALPPPEAPARTAGPAEIALGGSAVVDGVAVAFESVAEDSRCPTNAVCVWAGQAVVGLTLDGEARDLQVADPERTPEAGAVVGGRVVFATALAPEPEVDDRGDPVESGDVPVLTVLTVATD